MQETWLSEQDTSGIEEISDLIKKTMPTQMSWDKSRKRWKEDK
jgi:hypothetical protein